jgi:hypothetical protein
MRDIKVLQWASLVLSVIILGIGIPFYLGYGSPIPFTQNEYTFFDNMWLIVMPIVFLFTFIGLKRKRVSGIILISVTIIAQILSIMIEKDVILVMLMPILLGVLNLWIYNAKQNITI